MTVRTKAVAARIIGDAREAYATVAGANKIISKTEAKKLPKDLAAAVDKARQESTRVTVDAAVDAYASHVSHVLSAVDKKGKGALSAAEADKILDPSLRKKVLDVRAELTGGATPTKPTAAQIVAQLADAIGGIASWHDSGDNGVESGVTAHAGVKSLTQAVAALSTGWGGDLTLGPAKDKAAIDSFLGSATASLLDFTEGEGQAEVDGFSAAVRSAFESLSGVRSASTSDGGSFLIAKAKDVYVSVRVQPYSDG